MSSIKICSLVCRRGYPMCSPMMFHRELYGTSGDSLQCREMSEGQRVRAPVRCAVPYNWLFEMFCIKFVPTSEWRVQLRTEECAERTWERGTGAPLVPVQRHAAGGTASACSTKNRLMNSFFTSLIRGDFLCQRKKALYFIQITEAR